MTKLCSKCGKKLTGETKRVVPVPGHDPVLACPECEPELRAASERMAAALADRPREVHVARCDTLYQALLETVSPVASRIYLSGCEREGVIATRDGLANYTMGFVDAVYCITQGELQMATMERSPVPVTEGVKP